jgi:catechol 2,3-dioxygenase-like lactoylglutathione lyase family enzyme
MARENGEEGTMPSQLTLTHLNLPARDPVRLRQWYVDNLGFRANGRFLWSAGSLLVFTEGDPVPSDEVHFGFRVESLEEIRSWIEILRNRGAALGEIDGDGSYSTVFVRDPEGNRFEIFCQPEPSPAG